MTVRDRAAFRLLCRKMASGVGAQVVAPLERSKRPLVGRERPVRFAAFRKKSGRPWPMLDVST